MALIKIYTEPKNHTELLGHVAASIKYVSAAALNVPSVTTSIHNVETVYCEAIDIVGIDYIIEIIAVLRGNEQEIADQIISSLAQIYPEKLFSVYFNIISENGMASTPRPKIDEETITIQEAIQRSMI